jgi:hypothetical protein
MSYTSGSLISLPKAWVQGFFEYRRLLLRIIKCVVHMFRPRPEFLSILVLEASCHDDPVMPSQTYLMSSANTPIRIFAGELIGFDRKLKESESRTRYLKARRFTKHAGFDGVNERE